MRVLVVEPMECAYVKEIDGSLESMQNIVKGTIQAIYPFQDKVALVCNDDGKLLGMLPNRELPETGDIIVGPFFVCGLGGEDFTSLTDEQVERYMKRFGDAELILGAEEGIVVIKAPDTEDETVMAEVVYRPFAKTPRRGR